MVNARIYAYMRIVMQHIVRTQHARASQTTCDMVSGLGRTIYV